MKTCSITAAAELPYGTTVTLTGGTYPIREALKTLGLRFDGASKAWTGTLIEDRNGYAGSKLAAATLSGTVRFAGALAAPVSRVSAPRPSAPCRSCGTYCFGDCSAN